MHGVGDRVEVRPEFVVLSLRGVLYQYGRITGTIEALGGSDIGAPYKVKIEHLENRYRYCSEGELCSV